MAVWRGRNWESDVEMEGQEAGVLEYGSIGVLGKSGMPSIGSCCRYWLDGWMTGWMVGWVDDWMDGWMIG